MTGIVQGCTGCPKTYTLVYQYLFWIIMLPPLFVSCINTLTVSDKNTPSKKAV